MQYGEQILGWRDGETFEPKLDTARLNGQSLDVWVFMNDGKWHTPKEITEGTGYDWASAGARIRDWRKSKFGGHTVHRRRFMPGTFEYLLEPSKP